MNTSQANMSRRKFLGLAGTATLVSLGIDSAYSANEPKIDINNITDEYHESDVLVIGGGMAGLFAAVKAHDARVSVMMVSKGRLGSSGQTPFAKGIFSYDESKEKLSLDEFTQKVTRSALGTNNQAYTRQMAKHSLARVNDLREWGFLILLFITNHIKLEKKFWHL